MVKVERNPVAPASLAQEKANGTTNYRGFDVVQRLREDFHEKCYLCEIDKVQDPQIEHLKAHHNGQDRDRMFDWNNLFFSCSHCNSIKNRRIYEESVLDCCREEPERYISQELLDSHVRVLPLNESDEARMTAQLITECFERTNTGIRIHACNIRVNALQETMSIFYRNLCEYAKNPTPKINATLLGMLDRSYKFAGFTRTYIRQHIEDYPFLADAIAL